jgi:hypothetical protein
MIARASGLGMGVGRFSRPLGRVGVIAMLDAGLDTMRHVEVPPCAGVLQRLVTSVVFGIFIDCRCVADGVGVTRLVVSATRALFSEDEGMEF